MLTIDVDTADQGLSLDTILFVYFDSNPADDIYPVTPIAWNDVSSNLPPNFNNDPYLEITAEAEGNYYLVIYDSTNDGNTGPYTFSLKCTDPSTPPDPVDPLITNDLLGFLLVLLIFFHILFLSLLMNLFFYLYASFFLYLCRLKSYRFLLRGTQDYNRLPELRRYF